MKLFIPILLLIRPIFGLTAPFEKYAYCLDPRTGKHVTVYNSPAIKDMGFACMKENADSVIFWNTAFSDMVPKVLAQFSAFHECSHIQLFHSLRRDNPVWPEQKEQEADCLALFQMYKEKYLNKKSYFELKNSLANYSRADKTHYGGLVRANALDRCLTYYGITLN
jgi:hypothetical protein